MHKKAEVLIAIVLLVSACNQISNTQPATNIHTSPTPELLAVTELSFPDHILAVIPEPGESYTLDEYQTLAPALRWNATEPSVCVSVAPAPLLIPGDFPTEREWLARVNLVIDNQLIENYHSLLKTNSLGLILRDPETGDILAEEPDGTPYRICYAAELIPGQHTVTLVIQTSLGEEDTYTWMFNIVE